MSFAEEVEFNMFPGTVKTRKDHVYSNKKAKISLLKSAAIYGANGAGKSNFIKAVHFLHDLVVVGDLAGNYVKYVPFRLDSNNTQKPSELGIECQIGKQFFEYAVVIQNNQIIEESLYETFPNLNEAKLVFSRETKKGKTKVKLNPNFSLSEKELLRYEIYSEDLQPGQSFIFKIRDKLKEASSMYEWFKENLWIIYPTSTYFLADICFDKNYKDFLNKLLPSLNTGMQSLDTEAIPAESFFGEDDREQMMEFKEKLIGKKAFIRFVKHAKPYIAHNYGGEMVVEKIKTFNIGVEKEAISFELDEQSDGTRRLLDLIPAIKMLEDKPVVFFIDEIDRSLHPSMMKELMRYFMSHPTKGQLVFTTHESNLLDLEIFRQDEIWLTEKSNNGSTTMYSLSDFKPRYDLDIRKGYLAGRFGAIPFLGNLKDLSWQYAQE